MVDPVEVIAQTLSRRIGLVNLGDQAREILAALDAAGLAVVPKKPTPNMIRAAHYEVTDDGIWTAMLAAAPTAQPAGSAPKP